MTEYYQGLIASILEEKPEATQNYIDVIMRNRFGVFLHPMDLATLIERAKA